MQSKSEDEAAMKADGATYPCEFTVRNRLLAMKAYRRSPSWVGILKQYQVLTSPSRLAARNVTLAQLSTLHKANVLAGGGVMNRGERNHLLRIQGQSLTLEEVAPLPSFGASRFRYVLEMSLMSKLGGPIKRGDASAVVKVEPDVTSPLSMPKSICIRKMDHILRRIPQRVQIMAMKPYRDVRGGMAVMLTVQKQPVADTINLDRKNPRSPRLNTTRITFGRQDRIGCVSSK